MVPMQRLEKRGLRLDEKEPAMSRIDSGGFAIVPGDVVRSLLVKRVSADDESRMPPPSSHKSLTVEQNWDTHTLDRRGCRLACPLVIWVASANRTAGSSGSIVAAHTD